MKNYVGSFSSNVENNIDNARKKTGMIFASGFDLRKVNPLNFGDKLASLLCCMMLNYSLLLPL